MITIPVVVLALGAFAFAGVLLLAWGGAVTWGLE
jgi:hypothetical protein